MPRRSLTSPDRARANWPRPRRATDEAIRKTYYEPTFVEQERAKVVAFFDKYLAKP